jgi:hypothetical protein
MHLPGVQQHLQSTARITSAEEWHVTRSTPSLLISSIRETFLVMWSQSSPYAWRRTLKKPMANSSSLLSQMWNVFNERMCGFHAITAIIYALVRDDMASSEEICTEINIMNV